MEISSLTRAVAPRSALLGAHAHRVESLRGFGESAAAARPADPSALWVLAGSISGLCLLSGHIAAAFGGLVGLAYPAYLSVKALESPDGQAPASSAADAKRNLLTYWICYSLLQLVEGIAGPWMSQVCVRACVETTVRCKIQGACAT